MTLLCYKPCDGVAIEFETDEMSAEEWTYFIAAYFPSPVQIARIKRLLIAGDRIAARKALQEAVVNIFVLNEEMDLDKLFGLSVK